ncbi:hypothetical protein QTO34_003483 [Cnephaeus nilssonii]|uniref:Proline-rich protein 5-like n=1 Tax=Cnephaeus nilssonii TaxID=3371016 RepID=A0AA40HRM6_CNENI|nr:hypothetical protein QTO34_003483 [Eptesicus nilssonii]
MEARRAPSTQDAGVGEAATCKGAQLSCPLFSWQNQLLAKGLLFVEEKIKLSEGENRIEVLAEVWDHFFTETLPTLQAIFYPVQGQELTIRQISLLGFRDLVLLKVKLGDLLLLLGSSQLPPSIVQMLLILQSVHEPTGPSEGCLQLEELVKQVVSPFLGVSEDRGVSGPTYTLARRHSRVRPKVTVLNYASPMPTGGRPLNEMALTPLTEQEGEAYLEKCGSVRRHTVANAHSDIQLLAMATMMHSGLGEEPGAEDQCLLLPPRFSAAAPPPVLQRAQHHRRPRGAGGGGRGLLGGLGAQLCLPQLTAHLGTSRLCPAASMMRTAPSCDSPAGSSLGQGCLVCSWGQA